MYSELEALFEQRLNHLPKRHSRVLADRSARHREAGLRPRLDGVLSRIEPVRAPRYLMVANVVAESDQHLETDVGGGEPPAGAEQEGDLDVIGISRLD